ncbi:UvrD-helicase domain-containing protein [Nitrosophilus labii]|uniref:UvrD-helicase domain-containing protein n=1 Tax=Nitrosophilus labii TaxID=2706014 RepID=UPI001656B6B5|nr:UvrD-helicase domain-containing protein [Nitrosophilus labii]
MSRLQLTEEQQKIVDAEFDSILLINAYAGTGKTSTLVEFVRSPKRKCKKFLYLSYNSSMSKSAAKSFKGIKNVVIKTIHSLAYGAVGHKYKERLGNLRVLDMLGYCEDVDEKEQYYYAYLLLSLVREFANSKYTMEKFINIKIEESSSWGKEHKASLRYFLDKLPSVWEDLLTNEEMPFEHDFYLKLYQLSEPKLYFDYILVDEAQDINGVIIDIVLKQRSKKVFIGDTYQQIYSWRGASNSLEILSKMPGTKTLYLTQSFRCPQVVAALANQYLTLLDAPKPFRGTRIQRNDDPTQTTVVARTNAKLFDYVVENILFNEDEEEFKIHFVGGIKSYNFQDLIDIQNLQWGKTEYIRNGFLKRFYDIEELSEYAEEANEVDLKVKITIVRKYMKHNIRNLIKMIEERVVDANKADYLLTTGHKSKGLEWDNVLILDDFVNIKEEIREDGEAVVSKEELNLLYVAITRSKHKLSISKDYILSNEFIEENRHLIRIM